MSKFQSRFDLKKRLYHLKKDENSSMEEHLNTFFELISKLTIQGERFQDEDKAILLLSSLPPPYQDLVTTFVSENETLKVEDVIPAIMDSEHQASSISNPKPTHNNQKASATEKEEESMENSLKDCWIFSTRYGDHICAHREWFDSYEEEASCNGVTLATGEEVGARGKGDVRIKVGDGSVRTLVGVMHLPSFVTNVISVGRLDSLGYSIVMGGNGIEVSLGSVVVMKGERSDENLYILVGSALNSKEKVGGPHKRATKAKDKIHWCI